MDVQTYMQGVGKAARAAVPRDGEGRHASQESRRS